MTRQTAYQILTKYLTNPTLLEHSLYVEAVMQSLAFHFGRDQQEWGATGLLHDADYDKAKGHPEKHGVLLFELEPNSIPTTVEHAIKAHNSQFTHVTPESKLDWALICCDELTGIIQELGRKDGLQTLPAAYIVQKLNDKNAFKDVEKENIFACEEKLGIPLVEFVFIALSAMRDLTGLNPRMPERVQPSPKSA